MKEDADDPTVWLLMLGVAVVGSNSLALSPILNDVARDLAATPALIGRANAAYGAATAVSALLLGRLIDRLGAMRVLVRGLLALAVAMAGSAAATHWTTLAGAQLLAGAAAGVILPATYSLATAVARPGRQAETLGRVLAGWSISLVAGVPLSALVAGLASWRLSFALLAIVLAASAWFLSRLAQRESVASPGASLKVALRQPGVLPLLAICFLFMTAFYGAYGYLGDHARHVLGLSAGQAGLVVLAYGIGFGAATAGDRLVDRIGAVPLFPAVLAAVALVLAGLAPATAHFPALLALAAFWGLANHFGLNILVLLLSRASPECRGSVLALNSAATYAGAFVGAAAGGAIYDTAGFAAVALAAAACTASGALVAGMGFVRTRHAAGPVAEPND